MCDCFKIHPRIMCGGQGCHCHKTNIKNVPVQFKDKHSGVADILKDGTEITVTLKLDDDRGKILRDMLILGLVQEFEFKPILHPAVRSE